MKHPCRCRKCSARKTLNKHPDKYKNAPTCHCGGVLRVDRFRLLKEHKKYVCHCDGVHYPHRSGSSVWCVDHKTGPSEEEYNERY